MGCAPRAGPLTPAWNGGTLPGRAAAARGALAQAVYISRCAPRDSLVQSLATLRTQASSAHLPPQHKSAVGGGEGKGLVWKLHTAAGEDAPVHLWERPAQRRVSVLLRFQTLPLRACNLRRTPTISAPAPAPNKLRGCTCSVAPAPKREQAHRCTQCRTAASDGVASICMCGRPGCGVLSRHARGRAAYRGPAAHGRAAAGVLPNPTLRPRYTPVHMPCASAQAASAG